MVDRRIDLASTRQRTTIYASKWRAFSTCLVSRVFGNLKSILTCTLFTGTWPYNLKWDGPRTPHTKRASVCDRHCFIVRTNFIFYRILDDVNASRAASQQISFLFVNLRFGEVLSEHGKLFPKDLKRRQMKISIVAGFALLLLLVLTLAVGQYL
jgi:hypothetical protein